MDKARLAADVGGTFTDIALEFDGGLPRFLPPPAALEKPVHGSGIDEQSKLYEHLMQFLDKHVLPQNVLDGLVVHTEKPKPPPPRGPIGAPAAGSGSP